MINPPSDSLDAYSFVPRLESSLSDAGHIQVELRRVKSLLCEEQSSNRKRTSNKEQEIQKLVGEICSFAESKAKM
jgi:hypothetical protein